MPANGTADLEFAGMPIPPGISRGIVRSDADSLQRDNLFHFVLARKASTPVLLVGAPGADAMAGLFVTRALGIGDRPSFAVKSVRPDQISADLLKDTKLVILNDAPVPGGTSGQSLVDYVKRGGGLFVALGSHSKPGQWPSLANELNWSELVPSQKPDEVVTSGLGSLRAYKPGEKRDRDWNLALAKHDVKVRISGPIARTEITETFRNDSDTQLEGVYQFPLPADAQIDGLELDVKDAPGGFLAGAFIDKSRAAKIWQGVIDKATPRIVERPQSEIIWVPGRQ
jgi:hypothetical protein